MSSSDSSVNSAEHEAWKRGLAEAVRDPFELCRMLGLPESRAAEAGAAAGPFPLLVPRGFVRRMRPGDPDDPLLLQVLPRTAETAMVEGFRADPLDERSRLAAPGLVRKYAGRALLLATGACAVHCRYCFRREFPYAESGSTAAGLDAAIDAIAGSPDINEAILSGGDPLLLDDARLAAVVRRLDAIRHLRRLRIHSRLPVVLPERVTAGLVDVLAASRLSCVVVIHANHPAELDDEVARGVARLTRSGVLVMNQSVLLAGVNDEVGTLRGLSERLVEIGVVPYYLHLLDRVRGAAHFDVPEERGMAIHRRLREELPGYAVPRLAREKPGEPAKTWLG